MEIFPVIIAALNLFLHQGSEKQAVDMVQALACLIKIAFYLYTLAVSIILASAVVFQIRGSIDTTESALSWEAVVWGKFLLDFLFMYPQMLTLYLFVSKCLYIYPSLVLSAEERKSMLQGRGQQLKEDSLN